MKSVGRRRLGALAGISFGTVLLWAGPGAADWQYTQWGMSPSEVKAASQGAAVDNPDRSLDADGLRAVLVSPYQGARLPFTAVFLFGRRDRLAVVTLNPKDRASCAILPDILRDHYGPPIASASPGHAKTARWNDFASDNVVSFLDLGGGDCSIEYSKLLDTRNDGTL